MLNKTPLVTIMIPVYNRENLIEETLECALNQEFDNYEVVVVDNKSTDKTFEILKGYTEKYENLRIFQNEENLGPVRNWKVGIEKSRGKYLKILWSDDQISKDFLKKTVRILEENDDVGFVYTLTNIYGRDIDAKAYKYGETGKYETKKFIEGHLLEIRDLPVSPGNAIFRLEDIRKNLKIDIENPKKYDFSKYGAGNDLLIFLQTAIGYNNFYYLDEELSFFRAHTGSFTISNNLSEYYLFSKVIFVKENYDKLDKKVIIQFTSLIKSKIKYGYMLNLISVDKTDYIFILVKLIQKFIREIKRLICVRE